VNQNIQPNNQPNTKEDDSLVLTPVETARLLRISRTNCYEQIRQGVIPSVRIGKRIIVPRTALMRMLDEGAKQQDSTL